MKRWLFPLIVSLQVLYLVGLAGAYYAMDLFGDTIELKTAPVDPRDLFYGDYVVVNYEISTISEQKWIGDEPQYNEKVYVKLRKDGDVYRAQAVSHQALRTENGEVLITGQYKGGNGGELRIRYGIERFYVEENTGEAFEGNESERIAKVAVAPWGQKKIVSLSNP
ncbi:GDYXXLXY domain-containing protein [Pontibacillus sp. ALD_SL1]|uniref:GDYXXLXY domain-containing protein n=1 Tax=Pontibacillus sp. ALD_SL1 TaxID=2777185 RepID=UPI001A961DD8|nr:GDYXXLXY domain-containing protein [Pontibacillus sp. ALD_SL1]QST00770.1 GDYXXLXY domain-containing protein [Pontibacillus sp. ALD_SL1]